MAAIHSNEVEGSFGLTAKSASHVSLSAASASKPYTTSTVTAVVLTRASARRVASG